MRLTEFFAMEATEYLERLDAMVSGPEVPDTEEFVRLARALRGSALMAGQHAIAQSAGAFEGLARSLRERRRHWDEATKQLAVRAVDDFKVLVRSVADWTEAAESRAHDLTAELHHVSGRPSEPQRSRATEGLDAGTRAFLAREGSAVASALHLAARALQQHPTQSDPLDRVLKVMQPLRGLAILSEVPPLPDLLEGVEQAVGEIVKGRGEGADLLLEAGSKAVSRTAREIAAQGRAEPDTPETQEFARRLGRLLDLDADAAAIDTLFYDDGGPHVVQRGTPAARPAQLGRLELVSHGEHLRLAADELERAQTATQRQLRAQTLAGTFRALGGAWGGPLEDAVARFARAARRAVVAHAATAATTAFSAELRRAGGILGRVTDADEAGLAVELDGVTASLKTLAAEPAAAGAALEPAITPQPFLRRPPAHSVAAATEPPPAAEEPTLEMPPVTAPAAEPEAPPARTTTPARPAPRLSPEAVTLAEAVAPSEAVTWPEPVAPPEPVTPGPEEAPEPVPAPPTAPAPIAAAPESPAPPEPPPLPAPASAPLPESPDLAGSWVRYVRLIDAALVSPTSLDDLIAVGARDDGEIVSISEMVYSGSAALERALSLRQEIRAAIADGSTDVAHLDELIREVFDLVELGMEQG
jgi:chemotaxis protein histidine kinase CheA